MPWVLGVVLGLILGIGLLIMLPHTVSNPEAAAAKAEAPAAAAPAGEASATPPAATPAEGEQASSTSESSAGGAPNADNGKTFFASNCAGCHGGNAEGGVGPKLDKAAGWTLAQFGSAIHEGKTPEKELSAVMPRFSKDQVSEAQLADTHAYLQKTFNVSAASGAANETATDTAQAAAPAAASSTPAEGEATAGNAEEGKTKFAGTCAGCHGANAEGGMGPALKNAAGWTDAQFATALREGKTPEKQLSAVMPQFTADAVSDAEIGNIHAFLKTLN